MAWTTEDAMEAAAWMRQQGVSSLRLRSAEGAELALQLDPIAFTDLVASPPDAASADGPSQPPKQPGRCAIAGCEQPIRGTFGNLCRTHGLEAAGVTGAS